MEHTTKTTTHTVISVYGDYTVPDTSNYTLTNPDNVKLSAVNALLLHQAITIVSSQANDSDEMAQDTLPDWIGPLTDAQLKVYRRGYANLLDTLEQGDLPTPHNTFEAIALELATQLVESWLNNEHDYFDDLTNLLDKLPRHKTDHHMPQLRRLNTGGDIAALWNITEETINDLDCINVRKPSPKDWGKTYGVNLDKQ